MTTAAFDRLGRLASLPENEIDLVEGALAIALIEYPDLDTSTVLAGLDGLAAAARPHVPAGLPPAERIHRLNAFLFAECGFRGNRTEYYDPRNSYLNDVLARRTGIPISLSLVYTEVGRRLGLAVAGVAFPGHFLVKHVADPEIIVDPFTGTTLTIEECAAKLRGIQGDDARLEAAHLRPAEPRQVLVRMLRNLKQVYVARKDFARVLPVVEAILVLLPDVPDEIRDRGAVYLKLECFGPALRDFERYLDLAPSALDARAIRDSLPELRRQASQLQ